MKLEEKLKLFKYKGFTYDPITGFVFSGKGNKMNTKKLGYIYIATYDEGKIFRLYAHQFAWYITYNEVPKQIDHADRNRMNNKIENLRCITQKKNTWNRDMNGYYLHKCGKYSAHIMSNGINYYLGLFKTPEEAHQAYLDAKKIYHII